jgi:predicted amidohydrolase YtcJ
MMRWWVSLPFLYLVSVANVAGAVERFNFERSNFIAEVSPYQLWTPDPAIRGWFESIGRDRMDLTFTPLKTIIDAGAVVSYGSDWDNIPEPDPWFAIEGMITRQYPGRPELGRLNPDQRLDRETVIGIFARNGAMLMGTEDETGTIEVGKSADFIVIDQNILQVPMEKIHETRVLQTVLRGKTVYQR